jgi:hypothetical protein
MKTMAYVYRFNDRVAMYIGEGRTVYLSARDAMSIGAALRACAADIAKCDFTASQFPTREWTISEN